MGVRQDYRTDVRNVLVTSQIRRRFLRMEPGQTAQPYSHDLGHEIFLVLAADARNAMWEALLNMFKNIYHLADVWNELAPRAMEEKSGE